ncbi:unnamed protein product [Caretta caretta]
MNLSGLRGRIEAVIYTSQLSKLSQVQFTKLSGHHLSKRNQDLSKSGSVLSSPIKPRTKQSLQKDHIRQVMVSSQEINCQRESDTQETAYGEKCMASKGDGAKLRLYWELIIYS